MPQNTISVKVRVRVRVRVSIRVSIRVRVRVKGRVSVVQIEQIRLNVRTRPMVPHPNAKPMATCFFILPAASCATSGCLPTRAKAPKSACALEKVHSWAFRSGLGLRAGVDWG